MPGTFEVRERSRPTSAQWYVSEGLDRIPAGMRVEVTATVDEKNRVLGWTRYIVL